MIIYISRWFMSLFAWHLFAEAGAYAYYENAITGERRAEKIYEGYSPKNMNWLNGGKWEAPAFPPPDSMTSAKK